MVNNYIKFLLFIPFFCFAIMTPSLGSGGELEEKELSAHSTRKSLDSDVSNSDSASSSTFLTAARVLGPIFLYSLYRKAIGKRELTIVDTFAVAGFMFSLSQTESVDRLKSEESSVAFKARDLFQNVGNRVADFLESDAGRAVIGITAICLVQALLGKNRMPNIVKLALYESFWGG